MRDHPISRIMSTPLTTIAPDATIAAATALLESRDVHHLVVLEHGRLAGILSSSDLLKLALLLRPGANESAARAADPLDLRVRDLMQSRVAVVRENTSIRDVARTLLLGGFHAVPVLAADDTPVGIVTSSDLVALLIEKLDGTTADIPAAAAPSGGADAAALPRLLEVLRAADVYLHSGQSDQQHSRLVRAVARARELVSSQEHSLGL